MYIQQCILFILFVSVHACVCVFIHIIIYVFRVSMYSLCTRNTKKF